MSDTPPADRADNWESWKVEVTGPALEEFRQFPEKAAAATVEFVTRVSAEDPRRLSKPLTNELLGLRTARRGEYRALLTLAVEQHVL